MCVCVFFVCLFLGGLNGSKASRILGCHRGHACVLRGPRQARMIERSAWVPFKPRASKGAIEAMPLYFEALDKRSAIVVGPTAYVLNVVDAEADRGFPAPAPAATAASCARRRAAPCPGGQSGRGYPALAPAATVAS